MKEVDELLRKTKLIAERFDGGATKDGTIKWSEVTGRATLAIALMLQEYMKIKGTPQFFVRTLK